MSHQISPPDEPRASRKRLRVNGACTVCRSRKTRCDGRRPVCRACERRCVVDDCRYLAGQEVGPKQQPSITDQRHGVQAHAGAPVVVHTQDHTNVLSEQSIGQTTPVTSEEAEDDAVDRQLWSSAQSDGLGTFVGHHDTSVYGPSSTVAFLQGVLSDGKDKDNESPRGNTKYPVPERLPERNDVWSFLPRRRSADNFVSCFWDFIHPVFPVFYKPSFMRQYEDFWINESQGQQEDQPPPDDQAGDAIFQSTLNLVFALGCRFSDLIPDKEKTEAANRFYQASRQFFIFDVLDSGSLPVVQLLVLNGVYLQSTPHANRCWNAIGLAIRVAQGLGFHLEQTIVKATSQIEKELLRRVWYTCVNLDRLLAMTFGRPAMISKVKTLELPAMIDDEYLVHEGRGEQPTEIPSKLGLFVSSCRLMEVLAEVLEFLSKYDHVSKGTQMDTDASPELVNDALDLDRRWEAVRGSIPIYLQKSTRKDDINSFPSHVHLQQEILHCRFMLTRLLLLRPLLLSFVLNNQDKPTSASPDTDFTNLDTVVLNRSCEVCIQTALSLVDAIYENLGTLYRSSGWHAVYFTFSSAIVILASSKCRLLNAKFQDTAFETCWTRSLAVLRHFEHHVQSAPHAIKVLEAIRHHVQTAPFNAGSRRSALSPLTVVDEGVPYFSDLLENRPRDFRIGGALSSTTVPDVFFGSDINYGDWMDFFS